MRHHIRAPIHAKPSQPWRKAALAASAVLAAGVFCAPAQAQVSLNATAGNLRYTLIDLDPNDGIAPSTNFAYPQQFMLSDRITVDRAGQPQLEWSSSPTVSSASTLDRDLGNAGTTSVGYDGQTLSATAYLNRAGDATSKINLNAGLPNQIGFTLSPHTGIRFFLDVAVDLAVNGTGNVSDGGWGTGQLVLVYKTGEFGIDSDEGHVSGFVGRSSTGEWIDEVHASKTAVVRWDNLSNTELGGAVDYYTTVQGNVAPLPVPEPGEWAMLGVGGLLLGWRARRRQRA